jgi:hypothetical protein
MRAFDEHVGGRDNAAIRCMHNRRVVSDANNQPGIARERLFNGSDQRELAVFRDGDECLPALSRSGPACCASTCRLR